MSKWEELPMADRAQYLHMAVKNGYRDIRTIKEAYNEFAEGGSLQKGERQNEVNLKKDKSIINGGYLPEATVIANPERYNAFLETLPDNQRNTSEAEYRMHRYWELHDRPKDFKEGIDRGMFKLLEDGWHANSIAERPDGNYEFMKYPWHPTTYMELDAYNHKPEFKREYELDTKSEPYYMYIRRKKFEYGGNMDGNNNKAKAKPKRYYIGGSTNEARQKYYDTDIEFTDSIKSKAKRYKLNPDALASRIAREGPIDNAIRHYNKTNGKFLRGKMDGHAWGLDDIGSYIDQGWVRLPKEIQLEYYPFTNEHGRVTKSARSKNYFDGMELTAAALAHLKKEMKKSFPEATADQLDQYASAAYNMGLAGAKNAIQQGKVKDKYKNFIHIKAHGGYLL